MDEATSKRVEEIEASKARLIDEYIKLQDQADELNGRIFNLCCEIEALNRQIAFLHAHAPKNGKAAASKTAAEPPSLHS